MLLARVLSRLPARHLVQGTKRSMASLPAAGGAAGGDSSDQVVPSSFPLSGDYCCRSPT